MLFLFLPLLKGERKLLLRGELFWPAEKPQEQRPEKRLPLKKLEPIFLTRHAKVTASHPKGPAALSDQEDPSIGLRVSICLSYRIPFSFLRCLVPNLLCVSLHVDNSSVSPINLFETRSILIA